MKGKCFYFPSLLSPTPSPSSLLFPLLPSSFNFSHILILLCPPSFTVSSLVHLSPISLLLTPTPFPSSLSHPYSFPLHLPLLCSSPLPPPSSPLPLPSLLFSSDRTVKVWNLKTCTELLTLDKHFSYVRSVRFCPTSSLIFTASQSLIKVTLET